MTERQVIVVGAGPAGLAAAHAALAAGARVTLLDSAEQPGGQYHRTPPDSYRADHPERLQHDWRSFARRRAQVLGHPRCTWWPQTDVWALERRDATAAADAEPPLVHVLCGPADATGRRRQVLAADALVLATGAHDRVLPFPGWELPGVFTGGAAQALAKGERVVVGDRVVVAGTGPFLLPVAASLLEAGSRVRAVLEAGRPAAVARGWLHRPRELAAQSGKARELASYTGALARHRVPFRPGRGVIEARGTGRVEEVVTAALRADWSVVPGSERVLAVDALCVSHGFTPRLELPLAAGCALRPGAGGPSGDVFVRVDDHQRTSRPGVYAAGEITGIAGAPAARAEGAVAGWIAGGGRGAPPALRRLRRLRDEGRAFAERLARAHPIGPAWSGWLRPETVVCRCEGTDYAAVCRAATDETSADPRVTRLTTRAGLGPCQARVCGPTVTELTARLRAAAPAAPSADAPPPPASHHRPLAQPIRLGDLARDPEPRTPAGRPHPPTSEPAQ